MKRVHRVGQHRVEPDGDLWTCLDCEATTTSTDFFRDRPDCRRWR